MSEHTPGPWYLWPLDGADHTIIATRPYDGAGDGFDHEVLGTSEWIRVRPDDARLIAAAPDLLAACEAVDARLSKDCAGWGHEGDEESGVHDEDCRACAYEALHEWVRAAMLRARGGDRG